VRHFQILIVSVVKICKQCLQTDSSYGGLRPQAPRVIAPQWKFLASPLTGKRVKRHRTD